MTTTHSDNPALPGAFRIFTVIVTVVLVLGSSLLFAPQLLNTGPNQYWPWLLKPFNARFLGAIYVAALIGVGFLLVTNRWVPGRLAMRMAVTFTALVSVVSIYYLATPLTGNRPIFNPIRIATWLWFILYIGPVFVMGYMLVRMRRVPTAQIAETPPALRALLTAEALLVGAYGGAMLLAPALATAFWPWAIDDFHARIYGSAFITAAVGAYIVSRQAAAVETLMLGLAHVAFGLAAMIGLVLADASVPADRKVNWSATGTLVWVGAAALVVLLGAGLVMRALQAGRLTTQHPRGAMP